MKKLILIISLLVMSLYSYDVKTYIPKRAYKYAPLVDEEARYLLTSFSLRPYFGSLIEQESCIRLTYRKCWNPKSELKTKREQGVGFGQITRAYKKNGRLRFDTLTTLKRKYRKYLSELNWRNIKRRPKLQIRAMLLLWRDNYKYFKKLNIRELDRISFTDAAYNGGLYGVIRDRKLCSIRKHCNPNIWKNNVERTCTKSKRPLYGNRNACDINREHVFNVMYIRLPKYIKLWNRNFKP